MATKEDFAALRKLALNCLWSVQALVMHCDREWPPTGRRSIEGGRRSDHFERDCEARATRLRRSFGECENAVDNWRVYADPDLFDPIRATVAGRPVVVSQSRQYSTAHEAAHSLAVEMQSLESKADTEADADSANYNFVFVTAALRMLRDVPNVQAIEAGIEHEYQQAAKGLGDRSHDATKLDGEPFDSPSRPASWAEVARLLAMDYRTLQASNDTIPSVPAANKRRVFDLDAIERLSPDAADELAPKRKRAR